VKPPSWLLEQLSAAMDIATELPAQNWAKPKQNGRVSHTKSSQLQQDAQSSIFVRLFVSFFFGRSVFYLKQKNYTSVGRPTAKTKPNETDWAIQHER
jgi:hypothetical protein